MRIAIIALSALFLSSCMSLPEPLKANEAGLIKLKENERRAFRIFTKLKAANLAQCPYKAQRTGIVNMYKLDNVKPELSKAMLAVSGMDKYPVVYLIEENSPALKIGLKEADNIISFNNQKFLPSDSFDKKRQFIESFAKLGDMQSVPISIIRNGKEQNFIIPTQQDCDMNLIANGNNLLKAWANANNINLSYGIMDIAKDDDELSFIIAHEMAHIILGHTFYKQEIKKKSFKTKGKHEIEADTLAIKLMNNAGYNPYAAAIMHKRMKDANNGIMYKISFGYSSYYMRDDDRIKFLNNLAHKIKTN